MSMLAVILNACDKALLEDLEPAAQEAVLPKNIVLEPTISTNRLIVKCPIHVTRYEGEPDIEYLNKDGVLIKEIHGREKHPILEMTIIGLCAEDIIIHDRIEFRTEHKRKWSAQFSNFSVIDGEYNTTDLREYFSLDPETNYFYITDPKAQDMWESLKKGSYEFSLNPNSEDSEIAEEYTFSFEIR